MCNVNDEQDEFMFNIYRNILLSQIICINNRKQERKKCKQ